MQAHVTLSRAQLQFGEYDMALASLSRALMLDPIAFLPQDTGHGVWAVLHDRGILDLPFGIRARTSYPVLPWIGVIALGWALGPWFAQTMQAATRQHRLMCAGTAALVVAAGLLVGFGARLGSGCTSGHGVAGIARLSPRSIVATGVFLTAGMVTVFVTRHVMGG